MPLRLYPFGLDALLQLSSKFIIIIIIKEMNIFVKLDLTVEVYSFETRPGRSTWDSADLRLKQDRIEKK